MCSTQEDSSEENEKPWSRRPRWKKNLSGRKRGVKPEFGMGHSYWLLADYLKKRNDGEPPVNKPPTIGGGCLGKRGNESPWNAGLPVSGGREQIERIQREGIGE